MSIIGGKEVFLFSKVSAHLTYEGKTASNIPVHRIVQYEGETFEDTIKTNKDGFFLSPHYPKKSFQSYRKNLYLIKS